MNDNPFICHFQIRCCEIPVTEGCIGYGGKFTKEQLRSDKDVLEHVLTNLHKLISENIPLPEFVDQQDMDVIMYLPDLIN